ncbi:MAG: PEP-CTERM sorting domain-containing protein [Phycisphaerae bacterium]
MSKVEAKWLGVLVVAVLMFFSLAAQAAVIDVTVEPDKAEIGVGERTTLVFYGQLKGPYANADNGLFSWALDLVVSDPSVLTVDTASVDRSGWWNDASSSSSGTPMAWGLQGIYDSEDDDTERGLSGKVRLFSVDVIGAAEGTADVFVRPDTSDFADPDFQTWEGDLGGDYAGASAAITVPEPASIAMLGVGGMLALSRRKR